MDCLLPQCRVGEHHDIRLGLWQRRCRREGALVSTSAKKLIASTALAFALAACSGREAPVSTERPPAPTSPSAGVSSTPVHAPSPTSPSSTPPTPAGAQKADSAFGRYLKLTEELAADPSSDLNQLQTVTRGDALRRWQVDLTELRTQGWKQTGKSSARLTHVAPGSDARSWLMTYCVDGTGTDLVDAKGKSVRGEGPRRVESKVTVTEDAVTGSWFVIQDKVVGTC